MGRPYPLKIAPSHGGSGPHLIHGCLGPPSPQSGSAVYAGSVTDRQTDRQTTLLGR